MQKLTKHDDPHSFGGDLLRTHQRAPLFAGVFARTSFIPFARCPRVHCPFAVQARRSTALRACVHGTCGSAHRGCGVGYVCVSASCRLSNELKADGWGCWVVKCPALTLNLAIYPALWAADSTIIHQSIGDAAPAPALPCRFLLRRGGLRRARAVAVVLVCRMNYKVRRWI